jgi:peptide/nickel transport system ATP-binding protein
MPSSAATEPDQTIMTTSNQCAVGPASQPLIEVKSLRVCFGPVAAPLVAVDDVSFQIASGEVLGIVGESGCGKTATARSIMGLYRSDPRCRVTGQVLFKGLDLVRISERQVQRLRGKEISMIFQDPLTCLNPLQRIGAQVAESLRAHTDLPASAIQARTVELLHLVGIPHPKERIDSYPHQFSGGMRQRVMIALAIACDPSLLIADEPTTALDVTTQMQILDLLARLRERTGMAMMLITHDFGVVAEVADRVLVMYAGQCVETGKVREIFRNPQHPYTSGLLASIPSADGPRLARLPSIKGSPPSLVGDRPTGCSFRIRCDYGQAQCLEAPPFQNRPRAPDHLTRCWLPNEQRAAAATSRPRDPGGA